LARTLEAGVQVEALKPLQERCDLLTRRLARDEALVELVGDGRGVPLAALFGEAALLDYAACDATVRLRHAAALEFRARFSDGNIEETPSDRELGEVLEQLARELERAREVEMQRGIVVEEISLQAVRERDALATAERLLADAQAALALPRPRRRSFFAWLFRRRPPPTEPEPVAAEHVAELVEAEAAVVERSRVLDEVMQTMSASSTELVKAQTRVAKLTRAWQRRNAKLEAFREQRRIHALTRLAELTNAVGDLVELELGAPNVPQSVCLLLPPKSGAERDPTVDATLVFTGREAATVALGEVLVRVRDNRPVEILRQLVAMAGEAERCIGEVDAQLKATHEVRVAELGRARIADKSALIAEEQANAQRRVAQETEQVTSEAAHKLEQKVREVRAAWETRIDASASIDQLRADVATIEDGAVTRLSLVCDEARELITLAAVRLILDLARPLRARLFAERAQVAKDGSPKVEERFEDLRVTLPASLEDSFKALSAPGLGELLNPSSIFDPLFQRLPRLKKECVTRLGTRLFDIERATTRELFAATVFLSRIIVDTFGHVADEMLTAHERWIDARLVEEDLAYERARAPYRGALDLRGELVETEARLAKLVT
jgi:hypothetical protein